MEVGWAPGQVATARSLGVGPQYSPAMGLYSVESNLLGPKTQES